MVEAKSKLATALSKYVICNWLIKKVYDMPIHILLLSRKTVCRTYTGFRADMAAIRTGFSAGCRGFEVSFGNGAV